MAFNPDDFLAQEAPSQDAFNPDSFLSKNTPPVDERSGFGFGGIVEPALAIGTGISATVAGGLGGISQTLNPFADEGAGSEAVKGIQEAATYKPRGEAGQKNLETLGELMQKGIDIANYPISGIGGLLELISGQGVDQAAQTIKDIQNIGVSKTAGKRIFEETGSPLAATIAETAPEAVLSAAGYKPAVQAVKATPKAVKAAASTVKETIRPLFSRQSSAKQRISELLQEKTGDVSTSKYKLTDRASSYKNRLQEYINTGTPRIEKDVPAINAIKQGFDEGVIAAIKGASPADKHEMLKMAANMQRGKKNARFAMTNRPGDIVGDNLMKRFKVVRQANKEAGKRLDVVAQSLKGKNVDSSVAISKFSDDLDSMGVSIDDKGLNFKGSDIEGVKGAEDFITRINTRLNDMDTTNAYELHRLKKFIDENVSYGKSAEGLTGKAERVVKKLRSNIDSVLDKNFKKYDKVNSKYAETISAIDDFQDSAGKKLDLTGPNADKAVGTLLRRLMSNIQSRVKLLDSVNAIEGVAKKYGGKFNDDIMTQVLFADELDSVFKPVARTSIQGQIGQAVDRATNLKSVALSAAEKGIDKLKGINEDGAFKAIKKLLTEK